ncbi:MAG: hypothetical protein WC552_01430 [Candidatus Omnitrophota bacterium]
MENNNRFLSRTVLLTDWDWPNENNPKVVRGKIADVISDEKLFVKLFTPIIFDKDHVLVDVIISSRHEGYPIIKALPNIFFTRFSLVSFFPKFFRPLIAVNIYTEDGQHISIANLYLE